jgi:hypothetical protein
MPSNLRPVTLEFISTAPYRHVATEVVHRPAEQIFAAISEDPAGWGRWFPGFSDKGRYVTPGPHGVGSVREVTMSGVRYREQILAWDAPDRWAFYVEQAGIPLGRAFAEQYAVRSEVTHSVVEWTFALDPKVPVRVVRPALDAVLPKIFRRAMTNLSRMLG